MLDGASDWGVTMPYRCHLDGRGVPSARSGRTRPDTSHQGQNPGLGVPWGRSGGWEPPNVGRRTPGKGSQNRDPAHVAQEMAKSWQPPREFWFLWALNGVQVGKMASKSPIPATGRPKLGLPWPKTFRLRFTCRRKRIGPGGRQPQMRGFVHRFWSFRPAGAILSGPVATDGCLQAVWGPSFAGSTVLRRGGHLSLN